MCAMDSKGQKSMSAWMLGQVWAWSEGVEAMRDGRAVGHHPGINKGGGRARVGALSVTGGATVDPNAARPTRLELGWTSPSQEQHRRGTTCPKLYRFFVQPDQIDKDRPHTFLGVLRSYLPAYPDADAKLNLGEELVEVRARVMAKLGTKAGTFNRYFEDYATGMEKGGIREYVGAGKRRCFVACYEDAGKEV